MHRRGAACAFGVAFAAGAAIHLAACKKERVPERSEAPPPRPQTLDAAGCDRLFDGAQRELAAALPKDRSCKASADCEIVYTTVCNSECATASVPKRSVDAVEAKRKTIEATTCKAYVDADCPRITPRPMASCAVPSAICTNGDCALKPWAPP